MKKRLLLLLTLPLFIGCSNENPKPKVGFFKQFEDCVLEKLDEYNFLDLYDEEANRFKVNFIYDLHFGYSLKITEYDLLDWYHAPNEGVIAKDYESVTFEFTDNTSSVLFKRGEYVLYHSIVNSKDSFKLKAVDTEYKLTTTPKDAPKRINSNLVGSFAYKEEDIEKFSIKSEVNHTTQGLTTSISMKENELEFTTTNVSFDGATVTFKISGIQDGQYLKDGLSCVFSYLESSNSWKITINNNEYSLEKLDDKKEEKNGYFYNNLVTISNSHVRIQIQSEIGEDRRFVMLSELDEGGKQGFSAFFKIENDGESLVNMQALSGKIIFTSDASIELRHVNGQFHLYKNNSLLYNDLILN